MHANRSPASARQSVGRCALAVTSLAVGAVAAQQPRIANGQGGVTARGLFAGAVVPHPCRQPDRAGVDRYTVPVVDSQRIMCCFNGDTLLELWRRRDVRRLVVLPRLPPRARGRRHVDDDAKRDAGSVAAGRRAA